METEDLNNAEALIKDIETIKRTIHDLQFKLTNLDVLTYLKDMSQGIEEDWKTEENKAYELIAQAEEEQIEFERAKVYGE